MAPTIPVYDAQGSNNAAIADDEGNKTLIISLSTVLPAVAVALAVAIFLCCRFRRGNRNGLFKRGISPIDDDEIESWKTSRINEKAAAYAADNASITEVEGPAVSGANTNPRATSPQVSHTKAPSMGSIKKPPSLIVYQSRASEDNCNYYSPSAVSPPLNSASTWSPHGAKRSVELPQTPVLARAPNSRPGLTDETVQGDVPFIASSPPHRRQSSRLSKYPPRSPRHHRSRSSRSSTSVGSLHQWYGHMSYGSSTPMIPSVDNGRGASSPTSPRSSFDNFFYFNQPSSPAYSPHRHRGYSVSSNHPPRLSLENDFASSMSPTAFTRREEIGKAIG